MNPQRLPTLVVLLPLASAGLIVLLWFCRLAVDALRREVRWLDRALAWLPPRGRFARALGWTGLFGVLLLLLAMPFIEQLVGTVGEGWADGLFEFSPTRWVVAVSIGVVTICAAVAAWVDGASEVAWAGLAAMLSSALVALAARSVPLAFFAIDAGGFAIAATLALANAGPLGQETAVGRGTRLRALRSFLAVNLLASAITWVGWSLADAFAFSPWLILVGLLLRCGLLPTHDVYLAALVRLPMSTAMLLFGALIPAAILRMSGQLTPGAEWLIVPLIAGSAWCWLAAAGEGDFARTTGRWSLASAHLSAVVALSGNARATALFVVSTAAGSAAALYLTGSVERVAGHREVGRLRGLAAALPGVFGWSVIVVLSLAGAPPFAAFAGRLIAGMAESSLAITVGLNALTVIGLATGLACVQRSFLGIPRRDIAEPHRLHGRERLVLTLLCACAVGTAFAPATLWRSPQSPPAAAPGNPELP